MSSPANTATSGIEFYGNPAVVRYHACLDLIGGALARGEITIETARRLMIEAEGRLAAAQAQRA